MKAKMGAKKMITYAMGAMVTVGIALTPLYVAFAQPGDTNDPLVTRRFVEDRIGPLNQEIQNLRNIIASIDPNLVNQGSGGTGGSGSTGSGNFTDADRDAMFADLMVYFEAMYGDMRARIEVLEAATDPTPVTAQVVAFEAIYVPAGRSLIADAGVEFILRSGNATALSGPDGMVDATGGRDIVNGQAIPANHLLLVPRTDGRGFRANSGVWVMIKGSYVIN